VAEASFSQLTENMLRTSEIFTIRFVMRNSSVWGAKWERKSRVMRA
jgi:hypothetical protein